MTNSQHAQLARCCVLYGYGRIPTYLLLYWLVSIPVNLGARSAPLRKGLSNRPGKIHSHEKETVYFLPGRVGFTNNFDLPRGTNLIRISLPRLWLQLFRCGACLSGRASATVILRCKFCFEQLSGHPGLSTTIAKSIRLDKMFEILYYY